MQPPQSPACHWQVMGGLDSGWGAGLHWLYAPRMRDGVFASSDNAEGPLSQLTFSLSCEPPSAAGGEEAQPPDRVPRQQ